MTTDLDLLLIQSLQEPLQARLPGYYFQLYDYRGTNICQIVLESWDHRTSLEYSPEKCEIRYCYHNNYNKRFDTTHPDFPDNLLDHITQTHTKTTWYTILQTWNEADKAFLMIATLIMIALFSLLFT